MKFGSMASAVSGIARRSRCVWTLVQVGRLGPLIGGIRLRGATYDRYQGDGWERTQETRPVQSDSDGIFEVGGPDTDRTSSATVEVWLEPLDARAVILPTQTTRIQSDFRGPLETESCRCVELLSSALRGCLVSRGRWGLAIPSGAERPRLLLNRPSINPVSPIAFVRWPNRWPGKGHRSSRRRGSSVHFADRVCLRTRTPRCGRYWCC